MILSDQSGDKAVDAVRQHIDESLAADDAFESLPDILAKHLNLCSTWLMQVDVRTKKTSPIGNCFWGDMENPYWKNYAHMDIHAQAAYKHGSPNKPVNVDKYIPDHEFYNSDYYNGLLKNFTDIRYCMGVLLPGKDQSWMLGWHRSKKQGAFQDIDEHRMELLIPDLRRLAAVRTRLADAVQAHRRASDALDTLTQAVMLVDQRGRLLSANQQARELLRQRDGVTLSARGELKPSCPVSARQFERLVSDTCCGRSANNQRMTFPRLSGSPMLLVDVVPATPQRLGRSLVVVTDPAAVTPNVASSLSSYFSLTMAESRLVQELALGVTLKEAAERIEISINTAKSQLKSLNEKLSISSRAELMLIIQKLP